MGAFIDKFNPLLAEGIQKVPTNKGNGDKVLFDDGEFKSPNANDYAFQGTINVAADFPTLVAVQEGWWYEIGANVTDNDGTKTNTGTSWVLGDVIFWNGSTWKDFSGVEDILTVPANSIKVNATAAVAIPTNFQLAINQVLGRLSGNIVAIDLVTTTITVGDFTGAYAGLAVESNWTNNFTAAVAGTSGDFHFGTGSNGTSYYAYYGQSGWSRVYTDNRITLAALITELTTGSNWTKVTDTVYVSTASVTTGDLGQEYFLNGILYRCINGSTHSWIKVGTTDTVTITDTAYIPKPQVEVGKVTTNTFVIPAKYDIITIVAKAVTGGAGDISIGSAAGLSDIVAVTAMPTVAGTRKQLVYLVNPDYPTSSDRTLHITLTGGVDVTLELVTQKMFE